MINKLKFFFLIAVIYLAVGVGSSYAADLNFTNDTIVSINGNNYIILAGGAATGPLTVTATTLLVTAATPSFTLTSPNGFTLANNAGLPASACNGGTTTVVVPAGTTVTFTPNTANACKAPSGGGPLNGGGGSAITTTSPPATSSGTTPPPANTSPPITTPPTIAGCTGTNGFSVLTGLPCSTSTNQTVIAGCGNSNIGYSIVTGESCSNNPVAVTGITYNFGIATLRKGSSGAYVVELQSFLNRFLNLSLVVDGKFGPKTFAAVMKWQNDYGLVVDGIVGPKTKAKMYAAIQLN